MNLDGKKVFEKYEELMNEIGSKSSTMFDFLKETGLDENNAERLLNYLVTDENLEKHSQYYMQLIKEGVDMDYIEAVDKIAKTDDVEIEDYLEFISIASEKQMPIEQFIQIVNENSYSDILDKLKKTEVENIKNIKEAESEEQQEDASDKEESKSSDENVHTEVITHVDEEEKNFFTQTIEDLLGIPTETLEVEEKDGNLDSLVKSITDAISEDKRKTNLINNLRRIVILANKQIVRMTERMQNGASTEKALREQINKLTMERDDYKKKYDEISGKIGELSSIAALASIEGVKRIE
jgi:hypothetical protein